MKLQSVWQLVRWHLIRSLRVKLGQSASCWVLVARCSDACEVKTPSFECHGIEGPLATRLASQR